MITPEHNTDGSEVPIFEVIDIISNISYSNSYIKPFVHKNFNVSIFKPVILKHEPLYFTVVISPERCNFHNSYPFGDDPCFIVNYSIPIIHLRNSQQKYSKNLKMINFKLISGNMISKLNFVSREVINLYTISKNMSKFIPPFILADTSSDHLEIIIDNVEKTAYMPFILKIDIISQFQLNLGYLWKQFQLNYGILNNIMKKNAFNSLSDQSEDL
ncbi:hypothetical protein TVAG_272460 [Trichomonas vaginalis G3]|uniref:Uncharacterized protein n=1 Tax=Trichomonas vaginalis (strain ATCC PRA-98 / G3) TaxID=412133 RepID=A2FDW2_TRIV3|nr:hypothetical protein TVAGG3_0728950 [Trichomonas vaginalis G3]EAX96918.1 hypothetical protein TVAG_272460 [Trichomonas vaginalis G3]KAI5511106.1 hypothetical protein TVAGG3_0728950 [Trichomonas vaginalis G3]|eukprot:XP_001309848.1 hypothetical protein [Trichomonas vaginalis G3]